MFLILLFYIFSFEDKNLMNCMLQEAMEHSAKTDMDSDSFVRVVQEVNSSQEVIHADMLTVCVGGFHTTALCKSNIIL